MLLNVKVFTFQGPPLVLSGVYFLLFLNSFYYCKLKSFSAVCFLPTAKAEHKNLSGGSGAAEAGRAHYITTNICRQLCVVYTSTINPSGGFLLSPCEGCLLSICPISPSGKLLQSVWGMILLSAETLCMLNFSSIAQVGLDLNIPQILMERMAFHFILRAHAMIFFAI